MPLISSYAKQSGSSSVVDDEVYLATIVSAEVEMENGLPKEDSYGKNRLLVKFELSEMSDNAGGPITLRRSYAISYGAMGGQQAALAIMIGAAMGVPANDKSVRHVTTEQLEGRVVRVQTGTVERDGKTYTNVLNVLPPPKNRPARVPETQVRSIPEAVAQAKRLGLEPGDLDGLPDDDLDEALPF
jgi:hypothetical protein